MTSEPIHESSLKTRRTAVRRRPDRGHYERTAIEAILDAGLVGHVGFALEGQPYVIPMLYVRLGRHLYLHGSPGSRLLRAMQGGIDVCVNVTLIDGLVLARSALHHSMNYRSVVVLGRAFAVEDLEERERVLRAMTEHLVPGRWEAVRGPTPDELRQTLVLGLPVNEASAKVRTGPPLDDEADYALPVWAGTVPLALAASAPVPDARLLPGIAVPAYAAQYAGPGPAEVGGGPFNDG